MNPEDSKSLLTTTIDTPLPRRLAAERRNLIFVSGSCHSERGAVTGLEIAADGRATPAMAHSIPRPDLCTGNGANAFRSGFWAILPVPAADRPRTIAVELAATLADGSRVRASLGTIELTPAATDAEGPSRPPAAARARGCGIAICMATYEPPIELLERQIESIRAQTHRSWVCVISDDGSSPERLAEIETLIEGDRRFTVSPARRRRGFFHNFERALRLAPAEAELVALADQDDRWHPEKLELLTRAIDRATLAYSDARIVTEAGEVLSDTYWNRRRNNSSDLTSMLLANTVSGSAALFRRRVVERALPFPPAFGRLFHDHWLALVALALGKAAYVDRPLYDYVQHERALLGHERAQAWADGGRGIGARLRHFRHDRDYFYEHWRTTYFQEYCRVVLMARLLLARCGAEISGSRRRALRRLAGERRPAATIAWLALRQLRPLAGRDETLGAEGRLLRALLWRRLLEGQPRAPAGPRSWLPVDGSFPVERLGPLAPVTQAAPPAELARSAAPRP